MMVSMTKLDEKVVSIFAEESIFKSPSIYSCFSGYNIPSFIKDWLLKRYTSSDGTPDINKIKLFLEQHIPSADKDIKTMLLNRDTVKMLARVIIEADIRNGIFK